MSQMQMDFEIPSEFDGYNYDGLQAFKKYHRDKPELYRLFKEYAFKMYDSGRKHYGAKCIMEQIRFEQDLKYPDQTFKICNSYTALYARLLCYHYPRFKVWFRFRQAKGITVPHKEAGDLSYVELT